ncbi:Hypothetical protein, predicted lipoprotein [Metamycoplasma auris 15026]|uniref:Uncharacterized protein n=1 Tax=Metamycoplasma auris 15026 TaxID=1188233 RepID=N9TSL9_9BACT|nr:variable surface lipoprotein [Metamycoplasma auris]ENY69080.1 Hypothetical protein, predicted lipoprotein [Metamycoplasma auris 15026]
MKKINKILLSLGSVASLASLPLVAANCNGTNKQKEEKSPAKNPEKNKEGETSTTIPATKPETNTPKEKSQEEKALAASTYIYEVWGRDIYKYQPKTVEPKKPNELSLEDILKKQKANEEKATNANLVPKKIDPKKKQGDEKLVNGWLNSLKSLN